MKELYFMLLVLKIFPVPTTQVQNLPFTVSLTLSDLLPASFVAVHVYSPLCLESTLIMIRLLPRPPMGVVMIPGSDEMLVP